VATVDHGQAGQKPTTESHECRFIAVRVKQVGPMVSDDFQGLENHLEIIKRPSHRWTYDH
jgi:hypothetical protein